MTAPGIRARAAKLLWLLLVATISVACARFGRARQCAALTELVNPALDEIERLGQAPRDAANLRKIAAAYQRLAASVKSLEPADPDLKEAVSDYVAVMEEIGQQVLAHADAQEPGSEGDAGMKRANEDRGRKAPNQKARLVLDALAQRERTQAQRLDRVCGKP